MTQGVTDSTNPQGGITTPPAQGAGHDPLRLTEAEWRNKRKQDLADTEVNKLVEKVIELENTNRKLRQRETPEGGKALTPEETREWEAYRAMGKPADLKTELDSGKAATTERDALKREREVNAVAEIGKAKPSVLTERLERSGLTAKVQGEAPKPGEEDKRTVRVYDKDGKDLGELKEYAQANWADYLPSLFPQTSSTQGGVSVTGQAGAGTMASPGNVNPMAAALKPVTGGDAPKVIGAFDLSPQGGKA